MNEVSRRTNLYSESRNSKAGQSHVGLNYLRESVYRIKTEASPGRCEKNRVTAIVEF